MNDTIHVRSNARRDLLQSSQLFKNEKLVVWEYVSNSLQYVDPGTKPRVEVELDSRNKRITICDNGRGMDLDDLRRFFVMHGENLDRLVGRSGRGRFGIGKSAAFGIARRLRVTTVRNGQRSRAELTREAIDAADDSEIPVKILERAVPCASPNGTVIEIEDVHLRRLDQAAVVRYVERHLTRWQGRPTVIINSHLCEPHEPPVFRSLERTPDRETAETIGLCVLNLQVAAGPLEHEMQGVAVFSKGVWLSTTLAGAEGKPMANYIFGEIDVPGLDDDSAPIVAFDMSRSMQLNPENPIVQALLQFIGREIDTLRRQLVKEEKDRRSQEEAQRLQREADVIAEIINEDFKAFSDRMQRVRARTRVGRDDGPMLQSAGVDDDLLEVGGDISASPLAGTDVLDSKSVGASNGTWPSAANPSLVPDAAGTAVGKPAGGSRKGKRPSGGFDVQFRAMGEEIEHTVYSPAERVIYVNLDHPQVAAAKGNGTINDPSFRRLAYEVVLSEYAIAVASELASQGQYIDVTDPVFEIRETINRIARRCASLYMA